MRKKGCANGGTSTPDRLCLSKGPFEAYRAAESVRKAQENNKNTTCIQNPTFKFKKSNVKKERIEKNMFTLVFLNFCFLALKFCIF